MKSLQDRLNSTSQAWKPNPGDTLVGTVLEIDERTSEFGSYPLLIIEEEESGDEIAVHAFHTVLKNEIARKSPAPGDKIGIVYNGKDQERKYEKYRVVLDRVQSEARSVNWKAYADESAAESGEPTDGRKFAAPGDEVPLPDEPGADVPFDAAV